MRDRAKCDGRFRHLIAGLNCSVTPRYDSCDAVQAIVAHNESSLSGTLIHRVRIRPSEIAIETKLMEHCSVTCCTCIAVRALSDRAPHAGMLGVTMTSSQLLSVSDSLDEGALYRSILRMTFFTNDGDVLCGDLSTVCGSMKSSLPTLLKLKFASPQCTVIFLFNETTERYLSKV